MNTISETNKKIIAGRQSYKCANKPDNHVRGLVNYKCPLWGANINSYSFYFQTFPTDPNRQINKDLDEINSLLNQYRSLIECRIMKI